MKLTHLSQLSLCGEANERIWRSIQHLQELNNPEMSMEFTQPTDFWHWGADYMGRWIAVMGFLGQYARQDLGVRPVVDELIHYQNSDGSFGTYTDPHDFQEWFGMGRGLVGLLEYYETDPDPGVLASAIKLGDYYAEHYPDCAPCLYECYSNALEGLVQLAIRTNDPKYWSVARKVAEASVVYKGIRYSTEVAENGRRTPCAGQVHCQLSTARGLLDLYEATGESQYLQPVIDLHQYIVDELLWVSGGIGFYYFRPEENETCADADWLRLNLQLWRITREARFMHLAEHILLNQIYFNQVDNGGFCYLRGLVNRAGSVFDACCSHHGPRALVEALRYLYTLEDSTLWLNLFMEGVARLEIKGHAVEFETALHPTPGTFHYSLTMTETPGDSFSLQVRIPDWTTNPMITVNGVKILIDVVDGYAKITRSWAENDQLELIFPLQVRLQQGETLGRHILNQEAAAVSYGPQIFCLNDYWNASVRVHLARLQLAPDPDTLFTVLAPDRLEAPGVTPENPEERLVFTPLSQVGGVPSGAGRIHSVRSPYFKVWIPTA